MCDYSLHGLASRPAKVGEKLTTRNFGTGTRGFSSPEDASTAVCLLPGTEVGFAGKVTIKKAAWFGTDTVEEAKYDMAVFRQVDKDKPSVHHDALEFPDGRYVLLTELAEGQEATVLQLPAAPKTPEEAKAQQRLETIY